LMGADPGPNCDQAPRSLVERLALLVALFARCSEGFPDLGVLPLEVLDG
jgi:hypothetical protein